MRNTVAAALVGRERELAALRTCLDQLLGGQGRLVLVGGDAGVGKTALITALAQMAEERGDLFALGHAYDMEDAPPYGAWREVLQRCAQTLALPAKLCDFLDAPAAETARPGGTRYPFFENVVGYLLDLAALRPPVLALEDIHAADQSSLDLLRFVVHHLGPVGDLPLLLVASYRQDELHRRHPLYALLPRLGPAQAVERISLGPLGRDDVADFLAQRFPGLERSESLVQALFERTEGNPFFLEEVLRSLQESGHIVEREGVWRGTHPASGEVPEAVKEVLEGRLCRLHPGTTGMLSAGAVLGPEFDYDVLAEMLDVPEEELARQLDEATAAHLLREAGDGRYAFTHALVREVLHETTVLPRRRQLHRAAAAAIERRYAQSLEDHVEELALHFSAANDAERAPHFLSQAGDRAARLYAFAEAVRHYRRALELVELRGADGAPRDRLLTSAAWVLRRAEPESAVAYLEEALRGFASRDECREAAWAQGLLGNVRCFFLPSDRPFAAGLPAMEAAVPQLRHDRPRHAWLASSTAQALASAGRFDEAEPYALAALESAQVADDDESRGYVFDALGQIAVARGAWHEAQRNFEAGRQAFVRLGYVAFANVLLLSLLRGVYLVHLADRLAERHRWLEQMRDYAQRLSGEIEGFIAATPARLAAGLVDFVQGEWESAGGAFRAVAGARWRFEAGLCGTARLALARGHYDEALRALRSVVPQPESHAPGDCFFVEHVEAQRLSAEAALALGDAADARRWLEVHEAFMASARYVPELAPARLAWARYWMAVGEEGKAREQVEEGVALARRHHDLITLAAALREEARLRTAAGDQPAAQAAFEESLGLAIEVGAPYDRALAELGLARLRLSRTPGDPLGTELAERAQETFAALGAAPALAEALALGVAGAGDRPGGLTPRELEVLRLVAAGRTNREVAEQLVLSERTVDRHVSNIFHKIGVDNRSGATAYAFRHSLV